MPTRPFAVYLAVITALCLTACTSSGGSPKSSSSAGPASSTPVATTSTISGPSAPASSSTATRPPLATFKVLGGAKTTMQFVPSFVRALYTKSITTAAAGDAHLSVIGGSSRIVLPITGGTATVYAGSAAARSTVSARHSGSGLRLGGRGVTVRVDDFTVVLGGATPHITAQLATEVNGTTGPSKPVVLFTVKTSAATRTSLKQGVATVTGLRLFLTAEARTALDSSLSTTALKTIGSSAIGAVTVSLAKG